MSFVFKRIIIPALIILALIIGSVVYFVFFQKPDTPSAPEGKTLEEKIESVTSLKREEPLSPEEWQKEEQRIKKLLESVTSPKK